jgi:hypothetical protein
MYAELYKSAQKAEYKEDFDLAIEIYEDILRNKPDEAPAKLFLSSLLYDSDAFNKIDWERSNKLFWEVREPEDRRYSGKGITLTILMDLTMERFEKYNTKFDQELQATIVKTNGQTFYFFKQYPSHFVPS